MKRALPVLSLVLVLPACGGEDGVTSPWQGASKQTTSKQVMVLNLKAELDGVTEQMPLMQSFSYTGIEMAKNDTTPANDPYGVETVYVQGYGRIVMKPGGPIAACKDQPLPSEHRIENAFLGDSMSEPPCDSLVHYNGPKGVVVLFVDEKGHVLTRVDSVMPWGVLQTGFGKVMVYAQQTKRKIKWQKKCPPAEKCGGKCVDLDTDLFNCGACDNSCQYSFVCIGGKCVCPSGQKWCDTWLGKRCVDVMTDREHCGGCGLLCGTMPVYEVCENGTCVELKCQPPEVKCGYSKCVDLNTDKFACGACGNVCEATHICQAGKCVCPAGLTKCGSSCRDLMTDSWSCGACYEKCDTAAGESCVDGKCI